MRAGLLQFMPEFGSPAGNSHKITSMLKDAEFDLIVIPELSNSGYLFSSEEELAASAENPEGGIFLDALRTVAGKKNGFIVAGFCERKGDKFYNSSALIFPDGRTEVYRKLHLFDTEKKWFTPGDEPPRVYEIEGNFGKAKIGMMICFDWFFPETARTLSLQGAQIICHPSNLVLSYCQRAMFSRAVENRVFTITSNRTGEEKAGDLSLKFTGQSVMVSPKGEYLTELDETEETVSVAEIDPLLALNKNVTSANNIFEDRRTELYKL